MQVVAREASELAMMDGSARKSTTQWVRHSASRSVIAATPGVRNIKVLSSKIFV